MADYVTPKRLKKDDIKRIRDNLNMTQKEFADFVGCSKRTVERWESLNDDITGPIVTLVDILMRNNDLVEQMQLPPQRLKLRLYYMYHSMVCTIIDIDEIERKVKIQNYTRNLLYRAFGVNTEPTFEDYEEFLESRCFPRTRDKMKIELKMLDIPFYDPLMIIEKTQGRMADDDFWIKIER